MSDPFDFGDEPAEDDGRPQLPRKRYYDEPAEPPPDPKLVAWTQNNKQLIEDAARERGDYVEPAPPRPATDLNDWAANHKEIIAALAGVFLVHPPGFTLISAAL